MFICSAHYFFFIWSVFHLKKLFTHSQNIYFHGKYSWRESKACANCNVKGCRLSFASGGRGLEIIVTGVQEDPVQIAVVQISLAEHIMKCFHRHG